MGANGVRRAKELFDWKVIVKAYEELWDELGRMRSGRRHVPALPSGQRRLLACPARPVRTLCQFSLGQVLGPP